MVRRMPIMSAADRILASLETKRLRRTWNPDLHPRDSKGRFVETGGIARMWGGGLARVLRALGGRDVLVENLATHQRSRINASRLTMVSRPDGSAPTKSKAKVRDEDARRFGDLNRPTGYGPHVPEKDDNGGDHSENDHGDNGLTPDTVHERDDQDQPIGQDIEGQDLGAGPDDPNNDDDEPMVPQGRVMTNERDAEGNPLPPTQRGNVASRFFPNLLPIDDGGEHAHHVAGNGDALRAGGPEVDNHNSQFWDTNHARRAVHDLSEDYLADLQGVWPSGWDNPEAEELYTSLHDAGDMEIGDDKNDQLNPDDVDKLSWLADEADQLAELAHNDGRDEVARYAANLRDALTLAYDRFQAHEGKPIPKPRKRLAKDQPLVPRGWRSDGAVNTVFNTPQKPGTTKPAARGRGGKRFNSLDELKAHWQSGKLEPYTTDKAAQQRHQKETAALFGKLDKPQLSRQGTFVVAKMTVEKDGKRKSGYAVIVSGSGVRLAMSDRKGEALDFANRLEVAQLNGKPFDWDSPGYHQRLESREGQEMVRQASVEAKKAFADKAAKKRDGAAAKRTPAPETPAAPAAPTAQTPGDRAPEQYHRTVSGNREYDATRARWKQLAAAMPEGSPARADLEAAAKNFNGAVMGDITLNEPTDLNGHVTSVTLRDTETGQRLPFGMFPSDTAAVSFLRRDADPVMRNPDGSHKYPAGPERDRKWVELIAKSKSLQARSAQKWLDAHPETPNTPGAPAAPAERPNPLVQAAQQIADTTGAPRANVGVGHVGPNSADNSDGSTFHKPGTTSELRDYWKNGGAPALSASQRDHLKTIANRPEWKVTLADHFAFAIIQRGPEDFSVVRAYDGRPLGYTGGAGRGFKTWREASRFALKVGQVEEPSRPGQPVDWWDPELSRRNPSRVGGWRKDFGERMDDVRG